MKRHIGVVGSVNPIAKSCEMVRSACGIAPLAKNTERYANGRESRSRLKKAQIDTVIYDRIETIAMIK